MLTEEHSSEKIFADGAVEVLKDRLKQAKTTFLLNRRTQHQQPISKQSKIHFIYKKLKSVLYDF